MDMAINQRLFRFAIEVMENEERARRWLATPNHFLEGNTPLEYVERESGEEIVRQLLLRIEHGVFT
ncbi:MbcA/ParS/Xre antitoxin family protein [Desulfocurvibacter africanus]|uniref:MbcA/ParS/Xre antitoxin family protein n=1 Tax=Desulfocurvibacter africanus TaxID=873 RepID=UPI0002D3A5A9|nr:MbcA/ParS/Xre antitoxin family protein [Desulfocurvibacter africanus]